jgi:hypothetical protein
VPSSVSNSLRSRGEQIYALTQKPAHTRLTVVEKTLCQAAVWLQPCATLRDARGGGGRPGACMNTVFIQPRARATKVAACESRPGQPLNGGGALAMPGRGLVAAVCDSPRREGWRGPSRRVYEYSIHTASGAREKKILGWPPPNAGAALVTIGWGSVAPCAAS